MNDLNDMFEPGQTRIERQVWFLFDLFLWIVPLVVVGAIISTGFYFGFL